MLFRRSSRNSLSPAAWRKGAWRLLMGVALVVCAFAGPPTAVEAQSQGEVSFEAFELTLSFPDRIVFQARAISENEPIVRAELSTYSPSLTGSVSQTARGVEIAAGQQIALHYEQDFRGTTVVPNTPFVYSWHVWTEDGREHVSAPRSFRFEDTRFEWHVRQSERVAVWTHDRPGDLGQRAFDIAQRAVEEQRTLFGVDLQEQIQLIIYNDFTEFAGWHSTVGDFIGGEAFPAFGITTQIVPLAGPQAGWLNDVVPHEISHLYFAQAAENPTVSVPTWLNEGVASFNEFGDPSVALRRVERAASAGELLPLSSLKSGFGSHNEARARLAYDEALSAVTFIVERFGRSGLSELLAGYHSGLASEAAFGRAFGVDVGSFEAAWAEWVGAEPGSYVTATPWPFPTFPPSPTPARVGSVTGPAPTQTMTPSPATPMPTPSADDHGDQNGRLILVVALVLVAGLAVWLWRRWRHTAPEEPG